MNRGQVDVSGGGVDMVMAQKRLHHRQVNPRLGQRGPVRYLYLILKVPGGRRFSV